MAIIMNFLGFAGTTFQRPSVDNTGVALQRYSKVENDKNCSIVNSTDLKPVQNTDWVIADKYVLLSFALSRDWGEKIISSFEKPKVHLAIQGKNYKGEDIIKKIYTDEEMGRNVDCKWDGYYGIIRVSFLCSQLKDFNRISYIGIIIARDNSTNGSDSMSKIFKIGQDETLMLSDNFKDVLVASDKLDGFNKNEIKTETIKEFSRITRYDTNPVSSSISFGNGKIFISPANLSGQLYTLSGSNSGNSSYTDNKYYYDQAIINFQAKSFANVSSYPSYCSFDGVNFEEIEKGTIIKDIKVTEDYQPEIVVVYGGYKYKMGTEIPLPKLQHYLKFLSPTEEEFLQFFSFEGERYRTKFIEYRGPNEIVFKTVVSGIIKNKNPKETPYSIDQVEINESTDPFSNTNISTDNKPSSNYSIEFSDILNKFTNNKETINFYLPLIDEYKYYNLGEIFLLKSETNNINFSCYNRENIVKHYNLNLMDKFITEESAIIFDATEWTNHAVSKSWKIQNSDIPLNSINFQDASVLENEISEGLKSHFSYYSPVIELNEQDITSMIKMPIEKDFYTVLYCKPFLNSNNVDLGLKIKNNTLFYKFPEGSFDWNTSFKDNDFINYAISKNGSIGLSDQDRNECLTLQISDNKNSYSIEISTNGIKVNNNNNPDKKLLFHELLTNFYCGTERTLSLPGFSTNSSTVTIYFKYEKSYAGTSYTIFEKIINDVPVASGDRPLGLRKGGIIVNPLEQNEQLPQGTAEQINLKTEIVESNKLVGKGINILVCDPNGNPLDETVAIEYKAKYDIQSQKVSDGAFYFDGVNLSELKNTVNNSETGLVKKVRDLENKVGEEAVGDSPATGLINQVNQNTTDIIDLKGLEIFTVTKNKIGKDSANSQYESGDAYIQSANIQDKRIKSTSICIPIASIDPDSDVNARKTATCQAYSVIPSDGNCSIGYVTGAYKHASGNGNWHVQIMLIVINLPSNLASSTNLETTSIDETEENIELNTNENEILETLDEENLTSS